MFNFKRFILKTPFFLLERFQINNLDFSSDGTTFAISGRGGEIAVMDARNLEVCDSQNKKHKKEKLFSNP